MVRTSAAATLLGVSTSTLRSWERRYGFPRPHRTAGGHRQYELDEIQALGQALKETHNVAAAVELAKRRGVGPSSRSRLTDAFGTFDEQLADRLLEESLALRSLERTIEELLLPAVADHGVARASAAHQFAWRHATGWLSALRRLSPPASREHGVLIVDSWASCEMETLHAQALELVLRRAGLPTLALSPATDRARLGQALRALEPRAIVLSGRGISLDEIARLIYAVRNVAPDVAVFDYRGAVPDTGASTIERLGASPSAARDRLLVRLEELASAPITQPAPRRAKLAAPTIPRPWPRRRTAR
jgi:DNA-binding transcriptional MerR regulator